MDCKHCNYPDTKVVTTRQDDKINQTYRRRECVKCGRRFTTQEHFRENYRHPFYKTIPPTKMQSI